MNLFSGWEWPLTPPGPCFSVPHCRSCATTLQKWFFLEKKTHKRNRVVWQRISPKYHDIAKNIIVLPDNGRIKAIVLLMPGFDSKTSSTSKCFATSGLSDQHADQGLFWKPKTEEEKNVRWEPSFSETIGLREACLCLSAQSIVHGDVLSEKN